MRSNRVDNIGIASPTPSMMKLQTMPPVNYRGVGATSPMSAEPVVAAPLHLNPNRVDAKDTGPEGFGPCEYMLIGLSYFLVVITFPFSICCSLKIVKEYERAVIFRLGRILAGGARGPGLFFILPCIDNIITVDLRTITFDVAPQEILTKDSVTITVDAVVYFRIFNPIISVTNVENAQYSTRLLAATTLRNILGTKTLQEILQDRESIAHHMQELLDEATDCWGVKVERVEVKDVRLPVQMQRAMATEAEATREARAKVVAAEGEQKASVALRHAAEVINQSPVALQLRYLQTLTSISAEKNSTIIFPIPIELLKSISKHSSGGGGGGGGGNVSISGGNSGGGGSDKINLTSL